MADVPGARGENVDRRDARDTWLLSAPALVILTFAAAGPLLVMLVYSFLTPGEYGNVVWRFSTDPWVSTVLTRDIFDGTYAFVGGGPNACMLGTDGAVYSRALKKTAAMMDDLEVLVANPPRGVEMRLTPTGPQVKRRVRRNHTWVDVWVAMISGSWGGTFVDWNETKRQFAAGQVADARRAAEYLHIFVSDHLPLVATIDV